MENLPSSTRIRARIWAYEGEYNSDPTFYRTDIVQER